LCFLLKRFPILCFSKKCYSSRSIKSIKTIKTIKNNEFNYIQFGCFFTDLSISNADNLVKERVLFIIMGLVFTLKKDFCQFSQLLFCDVFSVVNLKSTHSTACLKTLKKITKR
jgi:hypothetical protein